MSRHLFVTGIGTDVGKTLVSAAICHQHGLSYWKPIQCGSSDQTSVKKISNATVACHPVIYDFPDPVSPHQAADMVGQHIDLEQILQAVPQEPCLIEGAGGLLVPLNEHETMLDLIKALDCELILVSRHYVGCINHTLLTLRLLKEEQVALRGIVFNGGMPTASETAIMRLSPISLRVLARIPELDHSQLRSADFWRIEL